MLGTLLALAATAPTVIDAERAFAQMAQDKGQWTAFRAYAAPDALMFTPQPVNAQEFLRPLKDPPKSVRWWPTKSWQSCDGTLAVNTGSAVWPDGHFSQFATVWQRQPDGGWKWIYDNGYNVAQRPREVVRPQIVLARCKGGHMIVRIDPAPAPTITGAFNSRDMTINGYWVVDPQLGHHFSMVYDSDDGGFTFRIPVAQAKQ